MIIIGRETYHYYILINKRPLSYRRLDGCFCDRLGNRIDSMNDFHKTLFEKQTGIKLKVGEWGEFKLKPITDTDRRSEAIKRIMKERFRKVKKARKDKK